MNKLQTLGYSVVGLATTASVTFADWAGTDKINTPGATTTVDVAAQDLITKAMVYLSIIAVMYGLWGGFQIVTAGGDEEKVKKGRTILIQVIIGIIVIWLAGSVVRWIVGLVGGGQ